MVDHALDTVGHWLVWLAAFVLGLFAIIESAMHHVMDQMDIAAQIQTIILLLLTVTLIVLALRVFGGLFRILLTLFLLLALAHLIMHHGRL